MNRCWCRSVLPIGMMVGLALAATGARATTIDFDHNAAGVPFSAPMLFSWTTPLTEFYAPLGVHFSGPAPGLGGAIVNTTGRWGLEPHSGTNFLGFNRNHYGMGLIDSYPVGPETISFDSLMGEVSIYAGDRTEATFEMQAFDAEGDLVDDATVTTQDWAELRVSSSTGIQKVVLDPPGVTDWVYDDLSFTPFVPSAPEPSTLALLGMGLGGLVRLVRPGKRKRRAG